MADVSPKISTPDSSAFLAVGNHAQSYEQHMSSDLGWAMTQGSLFFEGQGKVQETLQHITAKLDELGIAYAVVGGMALFAHGFRRYTEDVDILVTREGLKRIHDSLSGRGYLPPFEKSKNLRDTETQVKVEFLVTGGYPGDGKKKPVSFPDPKDVTEVRQGVKVINLPTLIELKLASGISDPHRGKDLTDVEEIIKTLHLTEGVAESLNPYVRETYRVLWQKLRISTKRYLMPCPCAIITGVPQTLADIVAEYRKWTERLVEMLADGVVLEQDIGIQDGCYYLSTYDRTVAEKYGMAPEDELFVDIDETDDRKADSESNH